MRITGNKYGILINKCCSSCKYKEVTEMIETRHCSLLDKKVKCLHVCDKWEVSEGLLKIGGYTDGKVKKKEYFNFLLKVRLREQRLEDKGKPVKPKTLEEIQLAFKYKYRTKSIYVIM